MAAPCLGRAATVSLGPRDVLARRRCAAGAHIVFIAMSPMNSMVMRGMLPNSVLNQTLERHGVRSSFLLPPRDGNFTRLLARHLATHGDPSICVEIKYAYEPVSTLCRARGALVLLDNIDNFRGFDAREVDNGHYRSVDAVLVQTREHAAWLAARGHRAIVLPHPHGNIGGWAVAPPARKRLRGVGFVVADTAKNMPPQAELRGLAEACCRADASLYIVITHDKGFRIMPFRLNSTKGLPLNQSAAAARQAAPCGGGAGRGGAGRGGACEAWPSLGACASGAAAPAADEAIAAGVGGTLALDPTRQQRFYESEELLELIDVGVVWRPGHQKGGHMAVHNRPPTRMAWWWSHGIPVVGYPMAAYTEGASRVGYPVRLLNVSAPARLEEALCSIASREERACLQRAALRGAALSGPQYSSLELLAAACTLAEICEQPIPREGSDDQRAGRRARNGGRPPQPAG